MLDSRARPSGCCCPRWIHSSPLVLLHHLLLLLLLVPPSSFLVFSALFPAGQLLLRNPIKKKKKRSPKCCRGWCMVTLRLLMEVTPLYVPRHIGSLKLLHPREGSTDTSLRHLWQAARTNHSLWVPTSSFCFSFMCVNHRGYADLHAGHFFFFAYDWLTVGYDRMKCLWWMDCNVPFLHATAN